MRQRSKLDSTAVQGADSYVVLKPPTWAQARHFITGDSAAGDEQTRGLAMMEALLPMCVVEWNWTGDDGEPLGLPADIAQLTMAEVMWLVPHVSEFLTPAKN